MPTDATGKLPGLEDTLSVPAAARPSEPEPEAERRVGPYRLLQLIGEGGMGEVWLAEQVEPRRRVAIKVIKAGMDTKQVVARFESERQALALMDHPAIAKVFDGGSTPEGRPYFVMEYVAGISITEHCDTHKLSTTSRLELFTDVCEGVQHAHQKAIIHRDLKPSNILVSLVDGRAQAKIIDFGIAKATAYRLTEKTLFTEVGAVIGTPEYMSPEQADLTSQDVDTRTDVYSLGVILYQLLTGELPFGSQDLRSSSYEELRRKLKEIEPPKPSTKLSTLGDDGADAAKNRNTDPTALQRQLAGDLDAITMKALEKERIRRYGTPSELAADIARHLRNEPVLARPPSTRYRIKKYVVRHRLGVGIASAFLLLLLCSAVVLALQVRRVTRERDRGDRLTDFMTGMFKVSDPNEARGNTVTAREILDRASGEIHTGLAQDPELQTRLMDTMGSAYLNLGLYSRAEALFRRVVDVRREIFGPEHPETLRSMNKLASAMDDEGHSMEAEKLFRETLDIQRRVLRKDNPDILRTQYDLAVSLYLQGRYPDAEKLCRETLDIQRRVLGTDRLETLSSMNLLATILGDQGHNAEAERLQRETLDGQRRVLGLEHPHTLRSMNNLASILYDEGHYAEAESLYRATFDIKRRVLGPEHPSTLATTRGLALAVTGQHHLAEAERLERETLDIQRRVLGPEHRDTLASMHDLATTLHDQGRYADAESLQREVLDTQRRVLGPAHSETVMSITSLGATLDGEGRYAEAESLHREALTIARRVLGPDHPVTAISTYNLGVNAALRGKPDEALGFIADAFHHGLPSDGAQRMGEDDSLKSLHGDPRFEALVAEAKKLGTPQSLP